MGFDPRARSVQDLLRDQAKPHPQTNSYWFMLQDAVYDAPGVQDVTVQIARSYSQL